MKIWLDDLRPAPSAFVWCRSVNEAKKVIAENEKAQPIELIDCDHDLGDFLVDGGSKETIFVEDIVPIFVHLHMRLLCSSFSSFHSGLFYDF